MRNSGVRFECLRLRPHDHIGWVFGGNEEFADLARPFLAEGAARGDRLMYVAASPEPMAIAGLARILGPESLQITSIAEVYGPSGVVDADRQRALFEVALDEAMAAGFTGIRVAADNTPLVTDDLRLSAWIRWEVIADQLMSERPITGLCAFNGDTVDVDRLRHLATLHPLSPASSPVPQFRLFNDAGSLCVEGEIDSSAIGELWRALRALPAKTGVVVDLASATFVSATAISGLCRVAEAGFDVIVRGTAAAIDRVRMPAVLPASGFTLQTA